MTTPLVSVRNVSKHFGEGEARVNALTDVCLDVMAGEVIGLKGPSGSGKTTLLNVIGCILEPSAGQLVLNGETVFDGKWLMRDLRRMRLERIGFIFQAHNLLPFLSVVENVALVLLLAGQGEQAAVARADELLAYLEVSHRRNAMPAQLSGGEAQRVAIARALANRPRIILADEPTAALDSDRARIVMDLLRRVAVENEASIITVTHDEKIFSRFDRLVSLRDGRIDG
ncbi:MAG: ABC transporter ATP-binding protein [Phreatobacter sp.]|nr:ABC transporter ATP-binding protein [Phreatobacter sp.]